MFLEEEIQKNNPCIVCVKNVKVVYVRRNTRFLLYKWKFMDTLEVGVSFFLLYLKLKVPVY